MLINPTPIIPFGLKLKSGYYLFPATAIVGTPATSVASTPNRLRALPILVPRRAAFDRLSAVVATGEAGKLIRLGLYRDQAGVPGSLLADSGDLAVDTPGEVSGVIAVTLEQGWYWIAHNYNGDGATLRLNYNGAQLVPHYFMGNLAATGGSAVNAVYVASTYGASYALPDPFGTPTYDITYGWHISLRAV